MSTTISYRQLDAAVDYKSISADTTLTASDSGKVILLDAIGEVITLPTVSAGLNYKFMCTVTAVTSDWTIINGADVMYGSAQVAGAVVACSAKDVITLVVAKFLPGDWVTLESDGTNWYVEGSVVTAAGCTFTT
jgi:hypothetical protein